MRQPIVPPRPGVFVCCLAALLSLGGCTSPLFRAQSPDAEEVPKVTEVEPATQLVGDLSNPWNTYYLKVEAVGLVTQLDGTGSDPPPSSLREQLIKEMQSHDVKNPARILASDDTSLVMVRGFIPPGAAKDDTFDVEVRLPPRSETASLRNGWLMQSRLREVQVLDNTLHSGHVCALAYGSILVDALFDTAEDKVLESRGRVLSGGIVATPRKLGLAIRTEHSSVRTSAMIAAAVNDRFHHFDRGNKSGVAKPVSDDLLELAIHPRYKHNIVRYLKVIAGIAVAEPASERTGRVQVLGSMLLEPTSSETAAVQLEACGDDALAVLQKGLAASDPAVRFFSAEALAYLDNHQAIDTLFAAARDERAFRWRALTGLAVLDQFAAEERLIELMNAPSVETRYGAFHALRVRNPHDPLVRGELLGNQLAYHVVSTTGDPLIHFSRSRRPEIVVFGHGLRMKPPTFLFAGKEILIKAVDENQVKVTRFRPGKETEHLVCSTEINAIVRAIAQLGGGYADVLTALLSAREKGYLTCRIELDALPGPSRVRGEEAVAEGEEGDASSGGFRLANPVPDMFLDRLSRLRDREESTNREIVGTSGEKDAPKPGFFTRMTAWFSD